MIDRLQAKKGIAKNRKARSVMTKQSLTIKLILLNLFFSLLRSIRNDGTCNFVIVVVLLFILVSFTFLYISFVILCVFVGQLSFTTFYIPFYKLSST
jgi:hypothetical protein